MTMGTRPWSMSMCTDAGRAGGKSRQIAIVLFGEDYRVWCPPQALVTFSENRQEQRIPSQSNTWFSLSPSLVINRKSLKALILVYFR